MVSAGKSAWVPHAVLLLGLALVLFPVYVAFVASSLPLPDILDAPMTLVPGPDLLTNYRDARARRRAGNSFCDRADTLRILLHCDQSAPRSQAAHRGRGYGRDLQPARFSPCATCPGVVRLTGCWTCSAAIP
jgi:hypothetical protein